MKSPLYDARLRSGLSQYRLGELTGINQAWISLIENRHKLPTPEQAERLAQVTGLHELELLYPERYLGDPS